MKGFDSLRMIIEKFLLEIFKIEKWILPLKFIRKIHLFLY